MFAYGFLKRTMFGWKLTHPPSQMNIAKGKYVHPVVPFCISYYGIYGQILELYCITIALHLQESMTITEIQIATFKP